MRVISGSARGRKLQSVTGEHLRPTGDRVKEALFSIIISREGTLAGKNVLDLCAGTGALGIEALSRGASQACFVDHNRESVDLISRNIKLTGFIEKGRVLAKEAHVALRELEERGERFQLVFLDPPYRKGITQQLLQVLSDSALLDDLALVVAEFATGEDIATTFGSLQECDRRRYGTASIAFYKPVQTL